MKGFLANERKKLRLDDETPGIQRLTKAGAFTTAAVLDFQSKVSDAESGERPILTVHPARPFAKGHLAGQLFANGSIGVGVKVGEKEWITYEIPLAVRELCYKLDQEAGLIPVGLESRVTNSVVIYSSFFCFPQ